MNTVIVTCIKEKMDSILDGLTRENLSEDGKFELRGQI